MRKFKDYVSLALKGMGMGASDIIPGVSGGTIAFITGIYEELVHSIKSVNLTALKLFFTLRLKDFWKHINGNFLLVVLSGILISIFSLSHLIEYLLVNYPIMVWSFFFGLITASSFYILRDYMKLKWQYLLSLVSGIILAYFITSVSPSETSEAYWFIFVSGAVAICAMILPGISGSFILLLMGKYQYILNAVNELKISVLMVFILGAAAGIISFSNLLSWLLKKFHNITVILLAGFMLGSLNKIWPWKVITEAYTDRHGEIRPLTEVNILPDLSDPADAFIPALLLFHAGLFIVILIQFFSKKVKK